MQVRLEVLEVDYRVDDQLPRSMVGDLTSSFCSVEWDRRAGNIEQCILQGTASTKCVDWWMLHT